MLSNRLQYDGKSIIANVALLLVILLTASACGDCIWNATGEAWLDVDQDGVRGPDELPLEGIKFFVDDIYNKYRKVAGGVSEEDGRAKITLWLPGCPTVDLEVSSEAPVGYELTTHDRIAADASQPGQIFTFGYHYTPLSAPTPTPVPDPISCHQFSIPYFDSYWLPIVFADDGVAWTTAESHEPRIIELVPDGFQVNEYPRSQDFLGHESIYDMALAPDGAVWVTTISGVTRFDTNSWTSFIKDNGMHAGNAQEIAVLPSKDVLVETDAGIEVLDPVTIEWYVLLPPESLGNRDQNRFRVLENEVFLVAPDRILRFWKDETDTPVEWEVVLEVGEVSDLPLTRIGDAYIKQTGESWITGIDAESNSILAILSKDLALLATHSYKSTGGAIDRFGLRDIEMARDGSVWLNEGKAIVHGTPINGDPSAMKWVRYDVSSLMENNDSAYISRIDAAPDGAIWFATRRAWSRCNIGSSGN